MSRQQAAVTIQANCRAWVARRQYQAQKEAVQVLQAHGRGFLARAQTGRLHAEKERAQRYNDIIRKFQDRLKVRAREAEDVRRMPAHSLAQWDARRIRAAALIQAWWKGHKARKAHGRSSPVRRQRDAAAQRIQAAFHRHRPPHADGAQDGRASMSSASPDRSPSRAAPSRPLQASWSQASRGDSLAESTNLTTSQVLPGGVQVNPARYQYLMKQVQRRIESHVACKRVPLSDQEAEQLGERCGELLEGHALAREEAAAAMAQEQRSMAQARLAFQRLQVVVLPSELPASAAAHQFSLPAQGSDRMARARQAHAVALAEVKTGGKWWRHFGLADEPDGGSTDGDLADTFAKWTIKDKQRQQRWERVVRFEQDRATPA